MQDMTDQLTKEQAIEFAKSGAWAYLNDKQRALFQINQEKLCMPFEEFHKSVEITLGRPVWTHEFAYDDIKHELLGEKTAPTFAEILNLIPEDKQVLFVVKS